MAKVSFSGLIASITGKLGGSVLQNSFGGYQIRTRVSPRNPRSGFQQLARGDLAFIAGAWRSLTPTQQQSFIDNATTPGQGFNLYSGSNINLGLVDKPPITTYVPTAPPAAFPLIFTDASGPNLTIQATGPVFTVPAGYSLLIAATANYPRSKFFVPQSAYNIIAVLPEGTDLSVDYNLKSNYLARYSSFNIGQKISLRSCLIDTSNGSRGVDDIITTVITNP